MELNTLLKVAFPNAMASFPLPTGAERGIIVGNPRGCIPGVDSPNLPSQTVIPTLRLSA